MRVAVIGAGPSGLATARVLREVGHDVVVFEARPDVGGVWSATRAYPGLGLQSDKVAYAFADQPMPASYPEFPDGAQVRAYLVDYVREQGLEDCIELSTRVHAAVPLDERPGWSVHVEGPGGSRREEVDWLVVCNGMYSLPFVPELPGREAFARAGGVLLTPSTLGEAPAYADRDLVLVGWGKSAADIATQAVGVAASVSVVARRISWKLPWHLGRVPWQRLVLTRVGEQILWTPRRSSLVSRVLLRALNPLRLGVLRLVQRRVASQLDLARRGLLPSGGLESFVDLATHGFYEAIDRGDIGVHQDCTVTTLGATDGRPWVELSDGTRLPCDVLVSATGYDQDLSMLDAGVREGLLNERGELHLYRHTLPPGVPRLAFVGWHNSFHSPIGAQVQAMWLAGVMHGAVPRPTRRLRARYTTVYRLSHQNAELLGEPQTYRAGGSLPDLDMWIDEVGLRLPPRVRAAELVRPIDPAAYAGLLGQLRHRLGAERPADEVTPSARGS